ncbi:hypothetical protein QZH41_002614 [Actinostola sp. cb2023]|nr:hypothetical protein QZH41_002614 [Actinostola sp. cb2023]
MIDEGSPEMDLLQGIDRVIGGLHEAMAEIGRREKMTPNDQLSIDISGGDLNQFVTIPFRPYHSSERQTSAMMEAIGRVQQSKKEWLLGRRLDLMVTVVRGHGAHGRTVLRRLTDQRLAINLATGTFWAPVYEELQSEWRDLLHALVRSHRLKTFDYTFTVATVLARLNLPTPCTWEEALEAWRTVVEWEHPVMVLQGNDEGTDDDWCAWVSGDVSPDGWVFFRFRKRIYRVTATQRIYRDQDGRFCHVCGMSYYRSAEHQCVTMGGVRRYCPGSRRPYFRYRKEETHLKKNSIVIDPEPRNCMGRAVLKGLQRFGMEEDTKELYAWYHKVGMQDAWNQPCGFAALTRLQTNLAHVYNGPVKIHVFDEANRRITFVGMQKRDARPLYLNLDENHFELITSITGWVGRNYFCTMCHKGYSDKAHHQCTRTCQRCKNEEGIDHYTTHVDARIQCSVCLRPFWNQACSTAHRKIPNGSRYSTCMRWRRCPRCLQTVDLLLKDETLQTMAKAHPECDVRDCTVCKVKAVHTPTHQCYIQPIERPPDGEAMPFHLCFFDFEARCLDAHHVVNKVVALLVCHRCAHTIDQFRSRGCAFCGRERLHVFETVEAFALWFLGPDHRVLRLYTFLAHNFKGYDSYPLLEWLVGAGYLPNCIYQGAKVMMMTVEGLTFKDSFNFITSGLRKFPETFEFAAAKGYFPHFFNREENEDYVGPLPPLEDYGIEDMHPKERTALTTWWEEERRRTENVFDFQKELLAYCIQDVMVMAQGCLKFRDLYVTLFRVDPFQECVTLAGTCLTVLKKNYLQKNVLAVVPPLGYRHRDVQSIEAMEWLWSLGRRPRMRWRGHQDGEATILGAKVDGYDPINRTVYQYHGCIFHGCPRCFQQKRNRIYFPTGRTMEDLYDGTAARTRAMREAGYRVLEQWGHEWAVEREKHRPFPDWINDQTPILPREALMGGRTNAITLHATTESLLVDRIRYIDVVSLYPAVMWEEEFPVGHPELYFGDRLPPLAECRVGVLTGTWCGLVRCEVDPPRQLYFPVLPQIIRQKLMFSLCTACASTEPEAEEDEVPAVRVCNHDARQRRMKGVWTTVELKRALERGYVLHAVHEAWLYGVRSTTIFRDYLRENLRLKLEASGWPEQCTTEEERMAFLAEVLYHQGIALNPENIKKNEGKRTVAKGNLNTAWGKLCQNPFRAKTEYVTAPERLFELLHDDTLSVVKVLVLTDTMLQVRYERWRESVDFNRDGNVVVGSFVTAHGRLRLLDQLERLGDRVLYHDTDSIIYTTVGDQPEIPIGSRLGQWSDECGNPEENWIEEFVALGPKTYAYRTHKGKNVVKCKGISLTPLVTKDIHLKSLLGLLKGQKTSIAAHYPRKIVRDVENKQLVTRPLTKRLRMVYTKRVLQEDGIKTYPFGY